MKFLTAALLLLLSVAVHAQTPNAPTGLTAANGSGNNINLTWSDNSSNETGFEIDRKLGVGGAYAQIDTVGANVTTYADTSAKTANRPYIYRVRATNGSGDSPNSNEDDAVTPWPGTVNNYKTDTATYSETPTTMPLPLAGGKFYDELTGAHIMRVTDESDGGCFSTNYTVWRTDNLGTTRLLLFNPCNNSYHIATFNPSAFTREGALQAMAPAPASLFAHYESANWSGLDADKLFVPVDAKFYFWRPSTNAYTLVKDLTSHLPAGYYFTQLYVSDDDNRFGVMFRNSSSDQGFLVWEQSTDTVKLDVRTVDMNGITMDKSGQYVYYVADTPLLSRVYTVNTGTSTTLVSNASTGIPDYQVGHNDAGVDFLVGDDQWRGGLNARPMSDPHNITLAWQYAPYWVSHHVSSRADDDNWTLMSTYGEVGVSADPAKYRRELIQIGVKGAATGNIRRLLHTRAMWTSLPSRTISGATNASPIVIATSSAHGFSTGMRAQISGVGGNTAANGIRVITVIDATHFSLNGTTGNGTYTGGGTAFVETYWDSPRATSSRDGRFVFWTSNWNGTPGAGQQHLFAAQIVPPSQTTNGGSRIRGRNQTRGVGKIK